MNHTIRESYMNLKNRNARARELKAAGYIVRVDSSRNQLIHPQYINDYPDKAIQADNGPMNAYYKTHFKAVYSLEAVQS